MKKWTKKEVEYLRDNPSKSSNEVAQILNRSEDSVRNKRKRLGLIEFVVNDIKSTQEKQESQSYKRRYEDAVSRITSLEKELKADKEIQGNPILTYKIDPVLSKGNSEATVVMLLSDWHYEEIVKPQSVNHLNEYNEEIASARINNLFQTIVKFVKIHQAETHIQTMVLALLGDFISGTIHDELKEGNILLPIEAIWKVQNHIASGIKFILDNTELELIIPCSPGNHSRITEKQRIATEHGNSLEWLMYMNLKHYFEKEPRVTFIVNEGYHTYVDIYDYTIRFHHGHSIRYGGGVGGIYIPVNKAIAQWNKSKRADLDCFGHYHQMKNDGSFVSNGSLIGWNSFAIRIKADYEKPKQAFFLVDKKRFVICVRPIILNGN